jgi:hypothetical protein
MLEGLGQTIGQTQEEVNRGLTLGLTPGSKTRATSPHTLVALVQAERVLSYPLHPAQQT